MGITGEERRGKAPEVSQKEIVYASTVAFLSWSFSIFNFFLFGNLLPVLAPVFGWTTTDSGVILTVISFGTFLTSLSVGPMADYLGRRTALALTVIGGPLSSGLMAAAGLLSGSLLKAYVVVVRSLSGYGTSVQAVNTTYLNEMYGPERRGFLYSFVQGGFPIGSLLAAAFPLILLPIVGWQNLFLIAAFPILFILAARAWLPESPRFIHLKEIKRAQREGDVARVADLASRFEVNTTMAKQFTYRQLFEHDLRWHTISLMVAFALQWFPTAIFLILATTVLTVGKGVSFTTSLQWLIISNVLVYVGYLILGYLGDRVPRRDLVIAAWLIAGFGFLAVLFLNGATSVLSAYTIAYFFQTGAFAPLFSYMGESFPTRARGTGTALVTAMGPIGALIAFAIFSALTAMNVEIVTTSLYVGGIPAVLSPLALFGAKRIAPRKELEKISV